MRKRRTERKLERLVLGALLASGAIFAPSADVTYDGTTANPMEAVEGGTYQFYIAPSFVAAGDKTLVLNGHGNAAKFLSAGYSRDVTSANLSGFTVNVNGGDWDTILGAQTIGVTTGTISNNTVNINAGNMKAVDGGGADNTITVTGNIVNIKGGVISERVFGGRSAGGDATGNTVTISGGTINGYIYGGYSAGAGTVSNNTVTINKEGISLGYIYGGSSMDNTSQNGTATGNTVNILAAMTAKGIYGGITGDGGTSSGNTLNVAAKGITVTEGGIGGFQNLNFYLPTDMTTNDVMLDVSNTATVTDAKVGVLAQGTLSNLSKGDKVTLLHANTLTGYDTIQQTKNITAPASIATVKTYTFNVTSDENNIYATITNESSGANEQAKSLVEPRAATTTFLNAGADMLASQGFAQAANAVALDTAEQAQSGAANGENGATGAPAAGGFMPFAAFGGSSLRAESGSYVNTKGFGLNVGFAREISNAQGKLLFGPMVEYGGGSYDSHLDDGTRGDGKAHYFGVGIMAHQVNRDGFYYEGSLRGGRVSSDYRGNLDGLGAVDYDSASPYIAAHLGAGKVFSLGGGNTLDGYCKYFYSRQNGDDTTIHVAGAADEQGSFDAVNSYRIRIGARLTHKVNERNSFYGGLAYQYEFKGDAQAHFSGNAVPSPSVKGSSGMLELGWQVKPGGPLTLDLGFTGWAGRQRGGSVQLGATWSF